MRFFFHEDAEAELDRAVEYYEGCCAGLGIEFAQEVYAAVARIMEFPTAWSSVSRSTRCLVNRFPFDVIDRIGSNHIEIMAVADLRRRPGYWQER